MEALKRVLLFVLVAASPIVCHGKATSGACPSSGLTHPVKALVPAYWGVDTTNGCPSTGLTGYWKTLAACGANCIAVVNPNSGPGMSATEATTLGAQYTPCIDQLKAAGVQVLAYIATTHASKPVAAVRAEYDLYKANYAALNGIFFDEGTTWYTAGSGGATNDKTYYGQVAALVSGTKVLNTGGRFEPSMTEIFDIVAGFEETAANWVRNANYHGMCPIPRFTTAHTDDMFCTGRYPGAKPYVPNSYAGDSNTCTTCSAKIAALVHRATSTSYANIINQCAANGYSYCYVTNDGGDGNPWDSLPAFFSCYTS